MTGIHHPRCRVVAHGVWTRRAEVDRCWDLGNEAGKAPLHSEGRCVDNTVTIRVTIMDAPCVVASVVSSSRMMHSFLRKCLVVRCNVEGATVVETGVVETKPSEEGWHPVMIERDAL